MIWARRGKVRSGSARSGLAGQGNARHGTVFFWPGAAGLGSARYGTAGQSKVELRDRAWRRFRRDVVKRAMRGYHCPSVGVNGPHEVGIYS